MSAVPQRNPGFPTNQPLDVKSGNQQMPVIFAPEGDAPATEASPVPAEPKPVAAPNQGSGYGVHHLHKDFMDLYRQGLRESQMKDNSCRSARFFQMLQMLQLTNGLSGATVEAGSFRGLASWMMCKRKQQSDPDYMGHDHFMIDSFEGLSKPVATDGDFSRQRFEEGAFTGTSWKHVRRTMCEFPETSIVQGWIPEAFANLPTQHYRFVHIDVDIYEPTLASLRYFYPRLVSGGMIVVDDYGPWPDGNWPGCRVAVEEFAREVQVSFATLDTGNAVIVKRP